MAKWYPIKMRLLFMDNGQVVTQEGIEESSVPPEVFQLYKNTRLFPTIEEAYAGKVKQYVPPVKKLIQCEDPSDGVN